MLLGIVVFGQSRESEVPGDHFSLESALELFKKSGSPEEFERLLNSADARVNNLDLNGDGDIDYIKVMDRNEGNIHAFILQVVISATENQDVAVIELEKLANGKAVLQITGDADIYGIETIIEPTEEVRINAGTSTVRYVVNVWGWPSVQYIYSPYYSTSWSSPWGWNLRPVGWRAWRPVDYYVYNQWWQTYQPYYSVCYTHRVSRHVYRPYRTTSTIVHDRHNKQVTHYRSNHGEYVRTGRSDYNDTRLNSRQSNNSINNDTNERPRSSSVEYTNPRSTTSRSQQEDRQYLTRSSTNRRGSPFSNKPIPNAEKMPYVSRQSWTERPSQDVSRKWQGSPEHNIGSRQLSSPPQESSTQRSSAINSRPSSSGKSNTSRTGNGVRGNKSSRTRGRQ
jgi:hypothetical protein